ncbi:MAG: hypothetical protein CVT59_06715 [Actinobacteria bacterium HGW-Actinobacteria-1]|nr:MAG: hypothetical protein CVT59_06715 [Actinobacteria bacterium HGW-Actinobacteria-1]
MQCTKKHRYDDRFVSLPDDQGGAGRHKCAGCAYDHGLEDGKRRLETLELGLDVLPESQAGTVRHKSPHAAYALGYYDGVKGSYEVVDAS